MRSIFSALTALLRRWRFVEDDETGARPTGLDPGGDEIQRLKRSLAREERKLADFRQFKCDSLARHCEASIRNLKSRLQVLEGDLRRAS